MLLCSRSRAGRPAPPWLRSVVLVAASFPHGSVEHVAHYAIRRRPASTVGLARRARRPGAGAGIIRTYDSPHPALRPVAHRLPAPRQRAHGPLQLHLRAAARRHADPAHRGHRPVAQHRRGDRADHLVAQGDGARLGRGAGRAGAPRAVPADGAHGHLPRVRRQAARERPPVPVLLHRRGARGRAPEGAGREAELGVLGEVPPARRRRSRAPQGGRGAVDPALQGPARQDRLRRHDPRAGRGRQRPHRRLHRPALGRHRRLQPRRRGGRRHHGRHARDPRRRPPQQHAQADRHLRGPGRAGPEVPPHAAALRHRPQEAQQAARRHQAGAAHGAGPARRGRAQLPLLPQHRVRREHDHLDARGPDARLRRREARARARRSSTPTSCAG